MSSRESGVGRGAQEGSPAQQSPNLPPRSYQGAQRSGNYTSRGHPAGAEGDGEGSSVFPDASSVRGFPSPGRQVEAGTQEQGVHAQRRPRDPRTPDVLQQCLQLSRTGSACHPSADRDPPGGPVLQGFGLTQESRKSVCDSLAGQDTSLQRRKGPVPLTLGDGDKGLDRHWGPQCQSIPLSSLPPALSKLCLNPKYG